MVKAPAAFTAQEIAGAASGRLLWGEPEAVAAGVSTDSRTIERGELFVPLVGPSFDGHDFLAQALAGGASGILLARGREVARAGSAFAVEVADTLDALGDLALHHRKRFDITVVAVTGSNGKTTTKELIAAILAEGGETLKSGGNLNNLVGLPHQVFQLGGEHTRAVFEMGMNRLGEIQRLTEIAQPQVAVITCIAPVHLEGLGSIEAVREAKGELLVEMGPAGAAVLCADDAQSRILADRFRERGGRVLTFGLDAGSDVRGSNIRVSREGTLFTLHLDVEASEARIPALGRHNVRNALAAAAAASLAGSSRAEILRGLARANLPRMRLEIEPIAGHAGCFLLNDAYNANPASVLSAMETASDLKEAGRVFGVLGDMKELGAGERDAHREIGRAAARGNLDFFAGVGELMALAVDEARAQGMPSDHAAVFNFPEEAAAWTKSRLKSGDWVLVKGSRSMQMERAAEVFQS